MKDPFLSLLSLKIVYNFSLLREFDEMIEKKDLESWIDKNYQIHPRNRGKLNFVEEEEIFRGRSTRERRMKRCTKDTSLFPSLFPIFSTLGYVPLEIIPPLR